MHTPCLDDFTRLSGIRISGTKCTQIGKKSNLKKKKMLQEISLTLLKWDFGVLAPSAKPLILEFLILYEK